MVGLHDFQEEEKKEEYPFMQDYIQNFHFTSE